MTNSQITSALILTVTLLASASPAWAGKAGFGDNEESRRVLAFLAAQRAAEEAAKKTQQTPPPPAEQQPR